jgi:hypothetical protein
MVAKTQAEFDVEVVSRTAIVAIQLNSDESREWAQENLGLEDYQWWGSVICVDHRYAAGILDLLRDEGFTVRGDG